MFRMVLNRGLLIYTAVCTCSIWEKSELWLNSIIILVIYRERSGIYRI